MTSRLTDTEAKRYPNEKPTGTLHLGQQRSLKKRRKLNLKWHSGQVRGRPFRLIARRSACLRWLMKGFWSRSLLGTSITRLWRKHCHYHQEFHDSRVAHISPPMQKTTTKNTKGGPCLALFVRSGLGWRERIYDFGARGCVPDTLLINHAVLLICCKRTAGVVNKV